MNVDLTGLVPAPSLEGEDPQETIELRGTLQEAEAYLRSFGWFPGVARSYFGAGIGGVVAVFLFELSQGVGPERDRWLWVVVGDLPSAYLVADEAPDAAAALRVYCRLMEDWVDAVRSRRSLEGIFPVAAEPTAEHADMLASRVRALRETVLQNFEA